jgi:hypothetical protein
MDLVTRPRLTRLTLRPRLHVAMGAALLTLAASPMAQSAPFVDTLLRDTLKFSASDLRALDAGRAVVRSLDTSVRQEIAHIAAVHIDATTEVFLQRFRDIVRFESGPGIPQIGRFANPPAVEDLAPLTLPAEDVSALRDCRPGHCDVKLPAATMALFRDTVDWSSPDATRQANALMRTTLFDLLRRYRATGNAALGHYDDGSDRLQVADEFNAIVAASDTLPVPVPALLAYLRDYPAGRPARAEDMFYWTVVNFGLKPTVRVNHVVIYPLTAAAPSTISHAIAIKQLYASHYFHTTLELRFLVGDDRPGRHGIYLVSITRARSDGTVGFKGLFLRPIISSRSRDGVRNYLEHVKRQVERPVGKD